jgi:hypothetical protein
VDRLDKYSPDQARDEHGRWRAAGLPASSNLLARVGSLSQELSTATYSIGAALDARDVRGLVAHLGRVATAVSAASEHISALPAEASAARDEAFSALRRTRAALVRLKDWVWNRRVNKRADLISALLVGATV